MLLTWPTATPFSSKMVGTSSDVLLIMQLILASEAGLVVATPVVDALRKQLTHFSYVWEDVV